MNLFIPRIGTRQRNKKTKEYKEIKKNIYI